VEPTVKTEVSGKASQDLELVRKITDGCQDAWEQFIFRYSGLIHAVVRRYLFDAEEVRDVYVEVLSRLHDGRLKTYEGRSALSTWLVLVARSVALDHLRRRFGRREVPGGIQRLRKRDQRVFQLYYVDGLSFDAVRHWMSQHGEPISAEDLAGALERIESCIDNRTLKRIVYDLHAPSVGAASGRMMEFLDWHRDRQERLRRERNPEQQLIDKEARETAEHVRALLAELPEEERRVLMLRFDRRWTAVQIAAEMGFESPRRSYTVIDKGLRRLRRMLDAGKE
jgi:DNA-directed RNA polymerase specialized sigma24 family protein